MKSALFLVAHGEVSLTTQNNWNSFAQFSETPIKALKNQLSFFAVEQFHMWFKQRIGTWNSGRGLADRYYYANFTGKSR